MRRFFFLLLLLPAMAFATSAPGNTDDRIVSSWQVDHPVATGMLSALSLGVWPARFGSDAVEKSVTLTMNVGYGVVGFSYVKQNAEPIFRMTRKITWVGLLVVAGFMAMSTFKRRRTSA